MRPLASIIAAVGTCALAVVLFAAGFLACAAPAATQLLSRAVSDHEHSPYALDDLSALAVASRDLTVDTRGDGGAQEALGAFDEKLMIAAAHSSTRYLEEGPEDAPDAWKGDSWRALLDSLGASAPAEAFTLQDVDGTARRMAAFDDSFALDADAIAHLDDCNALIGGGILVVETCAGVFLACLAILLATGNRRRCAFMLVAAPVLLIASFAAVGTWALVDFHGFFSAFHGVFFPQGNWTFPADSLLICMYPTAFWMGMGIIWLATTLVASIIVLLVGLKIARKD